MNPELVRATVDDHDVVVGVRVKRLRLIYAPIELLPGEAPSTGLQRGAPPLSGSAEQALIEEADKDIGDWTASKKEFQAVANVAIDQVELLDPQFVDYVRKHQPKGRDQPIAWFAGSRPGTMERVRLVQALGSYPGIVAVIPMHEVSDTVSDVVAGESVTKIIKKAGYTPRGLAAVACGTVYALSRCKHRLFGAGGIKPEDLAHIPQRGGAVAQKRWLATVQSAVEAEVPGLARWVAQYATAFRALSLDPMEVIGWAEQTHGQRGGWHPKIKADQIEDKVAAWQESLQSFKTKAGALKGITFPPQFIKKGKVGGHVFTPVETPKDLIRESNCFHNCSATPAFGVPGAISSGSGGVAIMRNGAGRRVAMVEVAVRDGSVVLRQALGPCNTKIASAEYRAAETWAKRQSIKALATAKSAGKKKPTAFLGAVG